MQSVITRETMSCLRKLELNVESLGGVVVLRASYAARFRAFWRRLRGMFARPRERNALTACFGS